MVFLIENNGFHQVRPVREEAEEKRGDEEEKRDDEEEKRGDEEEKRGDDDDVNNRVADNFPQDFNDGNDPELFDVPSLRCGRCNLIVFLGGRNYERNHCSHNVGFCVKYYNPAAICLG